MNNQRNIIIAAAVVILVVVVGGFLLVSGRKSKPSSQNSVTPTDTAIPSVDSSVKVNLVGSNQNREVNLSVDAIPAGTTTIDYELSYNTESQGLQGVIGTISLTGQNSAEKKLTLGTCSSGTCVYHKVVGKIQLTLKFNGNYGQKLYEKEYEL